MPKLIQNEEIILSKEERRRFFKSVERMNKAISELREGALYIDAVRCYMIRKYKLYLETGQSWKTYKEEVLQLSRATIDRYISAAKKIESWARVKFEVVENEAFLITSDMVTEFIRERQSNNLEISIKSLIEHPSEDLAERESDTEAAIIQEPIIQATEQGDLFSLHNKIEKAGYSWQKDTGKFIAPNGNELSETELSEFIDEPVGLKVFEETKKLLAPVRTHVAMTIKQFKRYYLAYSAKHHSPQFKKLVEAKYKEVESEVLGILHEVSMILD